MVDQSYFKYVNCAITRKEKGSNTTFFINTSLDVDLLSILCVYLVKYPWIRIGLVRTVVAIPLKRFRIAIDESDLYLLLALTESYVDGTWSKHSYRATVDFLILNVLAIATSPNAAVTTSSFLIEF